MNNERIKKLENLSKKLLSNIIFEETSDLVNYFGLITVIKVKISSDLSYLDVFVNCMKSQNLLTKSLAKKNFTIQQKYNKEVNIRKLPRIRYRYDKSGENSSKILDIIKNIKNENS